MESILPGDLAGGDSQWAWRSPIGSKSSVRGGTWSWCLDCHLWLARVTGLGGAVAAGHGGVAGGPPHSEGHQSHRVGDRAPLLASPGQDRKQDFLPDPLHTVPCGSSAFFL